MTVLRLPRTVYNAIRTHSEETYPYECCGALLGHRAPEGWMIEAAIRAGNSHNGSTHSSDSIAPAELAKIERLAQNLGFQIAGFYHSHSDRSAQFSTTDFAEANRIGCSYVITEVGRGKAVATHGFFLAGSGEGDRHFEAQKIQLLE